MKKIGLVFSVFLFSSALLAGGSGSSSKPLQGMYPIVLSHGLFGWGDSDSNGIVNIVDYWGNTISYLQGQGAVVYAPTKSATNSNEVRAQQLKDKINYFMASGAYTKVHVLGHSQGGLDSRYMISNLGMASKVRSLTTLNSVHRGSPVADIVAVVIPDWAKPFVSTVTGALVGIVYGGGQQDAIGALNSLTTSGMATFNSYTPNASATKYFSYGSYITLNDPVQHWSMFLIHPACVAGALFKGMSTQCDGLVTIDSQKWGTWKGGPSTPWYTTGVDHLQACNALNTGSPWYDVEGYFLGMATNAKNNQ